MALVLSLTLLIWEGKNERDVEKKCDQLSQTNLGTILVNRTGRGSALSILNITNSSVE